MAKQSKAVSSSSGYLQIVSSPMVIVLLVVLGAIFIANGGYGVISFLFTILMPFAMMYAFFLVGKNTGAAEKQGNKKNLLVATALTAVPILILLAVPLLSVDMTAFLPIAFATVFILALFSLFALAGKYSFEHGGLAALYNQYKMTKPNAKK